MWVCVILNIIIILCLFWENRSLRADIGALQKGFQENLEESKHSLKENKHNLEELQEAFGCSAEEIQDELARIREKEEADFETVSEQMKGLEKSLERYLEKNLEEFTIVRNLLESVSELCTKAGKEGRKHYSETKENINTVHEKCDLLQKNFDIIEELFRLQLVNSLIDDADNAMKLYEEAQKKKQRSNKKK